MAAPHDPQGRPLAVLHILRNRCDMARMLIIAHAVMIVLMMLVHAKGYHLTCMCHNNPI